MESIKFKRLPHGEGLPVPSRATPGCSGFDVAASASGSVWCGETLLVPTGFSAEVPQGYELQVRSRSGLAKNHGVFVINSPGTVDSDYRGEICVLLHNAGDEVFSFKRGERIAQLVPAVVPQMKVELVEELSCTIRSSGGFGSTGR